MKIKTVSVKGLNDSCWISKQHGITGNGLLRSSVYVIMYETAFSGAVLPFQHLGSSTRNAGNVNFYYAFYRSKVYFVSECKSA